MPRQKKHGAVASMNPDNMLSAGLADDFDGEITEVRLVPWDYDGNIDDEVLAVRITIAASPEDGVGDDKGNVVQHYSAGKLEFFAPSMDGKQPVDLDADDDADREGIYAIQVGRREQLNNNSNWAHFLSAAIAAGLQVPDADVSALEGVSGHFNRIPQHRRSGIVVQPDGEGQTRVREILVLTEIHDTPKPAAASSKRSSKKTASKKVASGGGSDDLDERLAGVVLMALAEAGGEMSKSKLPPIVIKAFDGPEKAKAVKRVASPDFLGESEAWVFDIDEGMLYLAE